MLKLCLAGPLDLAELRVHLLAGVGDSSVNFVRPLCAQGRQTCLPLTLQELPSVALHPLKMRGNRRLDRFFRRVL